MKKVYVLLFTLLPSLALVACNQSTSSKESPTIDDALKSFQKAGLEAENAKKMTKDDYGMAPMKAKEAKRFLIPSLGEDNGGRIFIFDDKKDLEQTKEFYDKLGKESAMLFSWTAATNNILIQVNGDLSEDKFNEYRKVLEDLK
ncbi:hypothetical protein [Priestia koreensis]|nr:hypothetical protein [Priestia koreensis]